MPPEMIDAALLKELLASGTAKLYAHKAEIDALNVFPVPDGDTGTNMYLTFQAALRELNQSFSPRVSDLLEAVAYGALMGARGNSGVIVSQFFRGFVKALPADLDVLTKSDLVRGLTGATEACYVAVRQPVEGTILTVIKEISQFATEHLEKDLALVEFLTLIHQHACRVLERTPELLPILKQAGVVDAGGQGLVYFIQGWVMCLRGEAVEALPPAEAGGVTAKLTTDTQYLESELLADGEISQQYCTEFILKGRALDLKQIQNNLAPHGDCLLVVGEEHTAKIHIHTNNPGLILDFAVRLGDLSEIQINNMVEQRQQHLAKRAAQTTANKRIGVVAVALGDGLERLFHNLGADRVVSGGQTMNPSTADLAQAVNSLNCPEAIILPNNSNIVATANQVGELVGDKKIQVVPTQSIPEGLAALLGFNSEQSLAENSARMAEKSQNLTTGEVTFAVRDSQVGKLKIKQGQMIALVNGAIVVAAATAEKALTAALKTISKAYSSLITVYYGAEVTAATAQKLLNQLEREFPEAEVELYYGGQPLYFYLFSVE